MAHILDDLLSWQEISLTLEDLLSWQKLERLGEIMSDKFDRILDRKSYNELERSEPDIISEIERLISQEKWTPKAVKRYVHKHSPQRWPLAVQCEQAARWIQARERG